MFQNDYGTVIDKWKVSLILSRAKRLGFRRHDLEDVQQQLVPAVLRFTFDVAKSNGATEATVLTALIDHQLITMKRARDRYGRRVSQGNDLFDDDETAPPDPRNGEAMTQALDVREAVADLPPLARHVCSALGEGLSAHEAACRLEVGWHTVRRQVQGIRSHFEYLGLNG